MQGRSSPFFFLTKKIGAPAGDLEGRMKPLERFSVTYFSNVDNSVALRLYKGLNGGIESGFWSWISQSNWRRSGGGHGALFQISDFSACGGLSVRVGE